MIFVAHFILQMPFILDKNLLSYYRNDLQLSFTKPLMILVILNKMNCWSHSISMLNRASQNQIAIKYIRRPFGRSSLLKSLFFLLEKYESSLGLWSLDLHLWAHMGSNMTVLPELTQKILVQSITMGDFWGSTYVRYVLHKSYIDFTKKLSLHSMEISWFFYHKDFTWNQFWGI